MKTFSLAELAGYVDGIVQGDGEVTIRSAATLQNAGPGQITFLSNPKYKPLVKTTKASAIITDKKLDSATALLIVEDPYYAFTQIMILLHGHRQHKKTGISQRASIADTATLGKDCHIHDFAVICDAAAIGDGCVIYPGVFIGPQVKMGSNCVVYPNAVIYDNCTIGNNVIIQANASVGQDGFGFATHKGIHHKIPQIGRVIIEDDVEIGSCATIERGAIDNTIIGRGSKIGDMVAIGHGTQVGPYCLLVPQVGIAGSATIGHHCVIGGQAGVIGHVSIGNMVRIGAQSGVINNVPDGATIVGSPAIDAGQARRAYSMIQYLPQMRQQIRNLQKQIDSQGQSQQQK